MSSWAWFSLMAVFWVIMMNKNQILLFLLALEVLTLTIVLFWVSSFSLSPLPPGFIFTLFTLAVGEASLGLSLLIRLARSSGSSMLML